MQMLWVKRRIKKWSACKSADG